MAASQRVQILTDKSAELSALVEYIRNPNFIEELSAEVKKLNALTEFEENKAKDARVLIAKSEELQTDLQRQRDDIKAAKEVHEKRVSLFDDEVKKVRDTNESLKAKELQQVETDKKHFGERQAIDKKVLDHNRQVEADNQKLIQEKANLQAAHDRLENKASELKKKEEELTDKANKIKALMGQ